MAADLNDASGSFFALFRREARELWRSPWDMAFVTIFPLIMLGAMAWLFSSSVMREIPVAVVDADHSSDSRMLLRMVDASPGVAVVSQSVTLAQAQAQMRARKVYAVILVPRDFTRLALRGNPSPVVVYYNASYMTAGQSASRDIGDAIGAFNSRLLVERIGQQVGPSKLRAAPVAVQADVLYNPSRSYELFLLPLIIPAVLSLAVALVTAVSFGRELGQDRLRHWLGRRPWMAMAAKLVLYSGIFSLHGLLGLFYVAYVRGDGVAGQLWLLVLGQPLLYLASAGMALMFVGLTRDAATSLSGVGLTIGTALAFSGATFSTIEAPLFTRVWSRLLPLTAYIKLQTQQLFVGSAWTVSLWPVGTLLLIILVAVGVGGWRLGMAGKAKPESAHDPVTSA